MWIVWNRKFLEIVDILLDLALIITAAVTGYLFATQGVTDPGWFNRIHWEITNYDLAGTVLLILLFLDLVIWRTIWRST